METKLKEEGLICVEYPGVVKNVEKAVETMGGCESLSEVFCEPLRLLQLHYRPDDRLCKPITASRKKSTSFVIKIKVKKKTKKVTSFEVIDFAKEEFFFNCFCDFQYLAIDDGRNVYDQVVPTKLDPKWLYGDCPIVLTPAWFSRSDSTLQYYYGKDKESKTDEAPTLIATSRRKRFGLAIFLNFEDGQVPTEPLPRPDHLALQIKAVNVEKLRKLFEERPIASRSAMASITGICEKQLKNEAPLVAYHFQNGPWRAMWVRFGYDPRKDPSARVYQTLDFRINRDETTVENKRQSRIRKPQQMRKMHQSTMADEAKPNDSHIIRPGKLPPSRQFFYQYCDVQLPEVQAMLAAIEPRTECHPNDGWLPEGTSFACRRIIKKYIIDTVKHRNEEYLDVSDYSDLSVGESSSESDG